MTEELGRIDTGWTIEGSLSTYQVGIDLQTALYLIPITAEGEHIESSRWTLVIDIDEILAPTASEQVALEISGKQLDRLRTFLQTYPQTSVIIITSRHLEYGWREAEKWVFDILNILNTDTNYNYENILHSLAYNSHADLIKRIENQNGPLRLLITGAAKTKAARTLETFLGHRSLFNFFIYDLLNIGRFVVESRLFFSLKTIFQNQTRKGGGIVTFIDDGAMYPAVAEISPSIENTKIIYLHIKEEKGIGNLSRLTRGLLGILAYAMRNSRKLTKTVNP